MTPSPLFWVVMALVVVCLALLAWVVSLYEKLDLVRQDLWSFVGLLQQEPYNWSLLVGEATRLATRVGRKELDT